MNFGFFADQDSTRYCYLRLRRLKAAVKDPKIIDALVEQLEVSGATSNRKMAVIERRIDELRETKGSLWHEVPAPEVLAASIFGARKRIGDVVDDLFGRVSQIQHLAAPVIGWLNLAGMTPHVGAMPGIGRANLVGYRGGQFMSRVRVVGIEVINDVADLDRALDDMKTSRENLTHASYIACTPALAAEFLWARAAAPGGSHWDADVLRRKLQASGCGLLLAEGDAVAQAVLPKERKPDMVKLAQLASAMPPAIKVQK